MTFVYAPDMLPPLERPASSPFSGRRGEEVCGSGDGAAEVAVFGRSGSVSKLVERVPKSARWEGGI